MKKIWALLFAVFTAASAAAETKLSFDALSRTRYEYHLNVFDAGFSGSDERSFFRFKFAAGLSADFDGIASAYLRIANESRSYIYNAGGNTEYNINEFLIDNLFFTVPGILDVLEIKAGRMDFSPADYGEGFLLADGTPLDGSRTMYFNTVKAKFASEESSVELIGIYNPRVDDLMPIANENMPDTALNDSNESAFIVYGRTGDKDKLYFEPYYMYKHEEAAQSGRRENEINAFGSYVKYNLNDNVILRGQAAMQLNDYYDKVNTAFGGYVFADLPLSNVVNPFSLGYVYLSGNDPKTAGAEGWNPLFSRYPWMSELVCYLYRNESGTAYWTNLQMVKADLNFDITKKMKILLSGALLYANESYHGAAPMFGEGKNRGALSLAKISYAFSKNIGAYVLGEYFKPGDFYFGGAKDSVFIRAELSAKL
ncbi:MAG: alginate export family protein [Endomicrobium sp.]|nr:alginate export family protein [Endomicrobium sp.]